MPEMLPSVVAGKLKSMWHLTFGAVVILLGLGINFAGLVVAYQSLHKKQETIQAKQEEIHVLVNERLDTALERIAQLGRSLTDAGVDIPDKPSSGKESS